MAEGGKLAAFSFGGTLYGQAACLQSHGLDRSVNEIVYACSGVDKVAAGTKSYSFAASLALSASEASKVNTLKEGATGAFLYYPGDTTSGSIKLSAAKGTVTGANVNSGPNSIITLDVTIRCDDMTATSVT